MCKDRLKILTINWNTTRVCSTTGWTCARRDTKVGGYDTAEGYSHRKLLKTDGTRTERLEEVLFSV